MSELKFLPLASITMLSNYRDVEPVNAKDPDIIELSNSIAKHGVMQPILVRPNKKPGHYELIFGHRRYVAAGLAKLETIPANIKKVGDDDILDYQVTENLQRKDVHPMDEAVAFKSLIDRRSVTVEEISARFAKKPEYITQRLKLNSLVPEAQKRFKENKMQVGHAILLARLVEKDQKEIMKDYGDLGSISDFQEHIDRNIIQSLSNAPFDTKDPDLFPQAGACTNCPKRSGCNLLLFADVKEVDRCFDKDCFSTKSAKAFLINLENIINNKPEILLVKERWRELPKSINDYCQKMKVKVLADGDDVSGHTYTGSRFKVKARAFYLNGYDAGKVKTVYLPGKVTKDQNGDTVKEDPQVVIAGIKERQARAKVLDECKIHHSIIEAVKDKPEMDTKPFKFQPIDRGIMVFILIKHAGLEFDNIKGVPKDNRELGYNLDYFQKLAEITDETLALIIRKVVLDRYANGNLQWGVHTDDGPIRIIATYLGVDIIGIETDQKEIANKRIARANERMKALKTKVTKKPKKKTK